MTDRLRLSPRHRRILTSLLRKHLPDVEVWAYGSRVNDRSHEGSDLDLVLRGPGLREIPFERLMDFEDSVRESTIPFLVEARDWARLPERFHWEIEREYVVLVSSSTRWQEARLGDVVRLVSGGTPSKKREEYWNGAIPWASARDMRQFRLHDTTHHVTAEGLANGTKQVPVGTILLLTRGMRLLKELPVCVTERPMAFNQDIKALLPKTRMNSGFLPYLVLGNKQRLLNLVDLAGHGTGRINSDELRALDVRLPPTSEQRAIAHILGKLDDKIELNRRMNETLEMTVRALFKSWFVDFDPVRAKMESRDTGLPQHIADLFPDRLVDSEMGDVPEGWAHETVYRFADIVYGAPFASKQFNTENKGVPLIRIRDLATHNPGVWTQQVHPRGHLIGPGDIVVGMDGAFRLEVWKGPSSWLNQRVCHFEPRPGIPTSFLVGALQEPLAFFERGKVGTTVIHLGKRDLDTIRLLHPGQEILGTFGKAGELLLRQAVANNCEARTLAALRDTLLPKLISGEIRVGDADEAMEFIG